MSLSKESAVGRSPLGQQSSRNLDGSTSEEVEAVGSQMTAEYSAAPTLSALADLSDD